jgi:putative SOS response-associated peptidase YedK
MCGKFTQMASWAHVVAWSDSLAAGKDMAKGENTIASAGSIETVTPMRDALVLHLDAEGQRRMTRMRWGWSKPVPQGLSARPDHIHARAESIDERPTFRDAFARRRGILVVQSFNAGQPVTTSKTLQHVITPDDGAPLGIAVLWTPAPHDGAPYAFVMVTVPANTLIGTVTDRMPAILAPEDWSAWLGEEQSSPERLKALLQPVEGTWTMRRQSRSTRATPPAQPLLPI